VYHCLVHHQSPRIIFGRKNKYVGARVIPSNLVGILEPHYLHLVYPKLECARSQRVIELTGADKEKKWSNVLWEQRYGDEKVKGTLSRNQLAREEHGALGWFYAQFPARGFSPR